MANWLNTLNPGYAWWLVLLAIALFLLLAYGTFVGGRAAWRNRPEIPGWGWALILVVVAILVALCAGLVPCASCCEVQTVVTAPVVVPPVVAPAPAPAGVPNDLVSVCKPFAAMLTVGDCDAKYGALASDVATNHVCGLCVSCDDFGGYESSTCWSDLRRFQHMITPNNPAPLAGAH